MRYRSLFAILLRLGAASLLTAAAARAEPTPGDATNMQSTHTVVSTTSAPSRNHAYLELGGRGGLFGAGYERKLGWHTSVGAVLSFYRITDQTTSVVAPYVGVRPLTRGRHSWFVELGPRWIRQDIRSAVEGWDGATTATVSAAMTTGYRYEGPVIVRAYLMINVADGGVAPWAGTSVGWGF